MSASYITCIAGLSPASRAAKSIQRIAEANPEFNRWLVSQQAISIVQGRIAPHCNTCRCSVPVQSGSFTPPVQQPQWVTQTQQQPIWYNQPNRSETPHSLPIYSAPVAPDFNYAPAVHPVYPPAGLEANSTAPMHSVYSTPCISAVNPSTTGPNWPVTALNQNLGGTRVEPPQPQTAAVKGPVLPIENSRIVIERQSSPELPSKCHYTQPQTAAARDPAPLFENTRKVITRKSSSDELLLKCKREKCKSLKKRKNEKAIARVIKLANGRDNSSETSEDESPARRITKNPKKQKPNKSPEPELPSDKSRSRPRSAERSTVKPKEIRRSQENPRERERRVEKSEYRPTHRPHQKRGYKSSEGKKSFNANETPIGKRKFKEVQRVYQDVNKRLYNHAKYPNIDKETTSATSKTVEIDVEIVKEVNPTADEIQSMAQEESIKLDDKLGLGSPKYEAAQVSDSDSGAIHAQSDSDSSTNTKRSWKKMNAEFHGRR